MFIKNIIIKIKNINIIKFNLKKNSIIIIYKFILKN